MLRVLLLQQGRQRIGFIPIKTTLTFSPISVADHFELSSGVSLDRGHFGVYYDVCIGSVVLPAILLHEPRTMENDVLLRPPM